MKKRVIVVLVSFFICNFIPRFPQHALASFSSKHYIEELSKQLFKAHEAYNIAQVETILDKALHIFSSNKAHYYSFITTPNAQGFTILQYAAATADHKSIERIINTLKNYFADDIQSILKVLLNKGNIHCSSLLLLSRINEYPAFASFLEGSLNALDNNQEYCAQLLSDKQQGTEWNAFHLVVKNSCTAQAKLLVKKAKELFGDQSALYNQCLNAYDAFGNSALVYVCAAELRNFLLKNQALYLKLKSPMQRGFEQARAQGILLIQALGNNDFKQYSTLLENIIKQYADNTPLLSAALSAQGQDHYWTFFHHAAVNNQYDFLLSFFNTICPLFKDNIEDLLSIINAKDEEGKTGLMFVLSRKYFSTAHMLINKFKEAVPQKLYFYMIMNNKEEYNNRTPLLAATYNSTDTHDHAYFKTINLMIQSMKSKFPLGSHAFYHFINAEDTMRATPLSYANSPRLRALLINSGAIDTTARSSGQKRTSYFGI